MSGLPQPGGLVSRRRLLARAAVFGAAGLTVSGCSISLRVPGLPTGSAPNDATTAARQPHKTGGTLRIGRLEDISLAGIPHLLAPANFQISNLIYDTLIVYDQQLVPQPRLATSWAWSPDFLQLSLELRPDVRFHTGRLFTSEDARFNLERLRDPSVGSQFRNYAELMHVSTPAPNKLVITYDAPIRSSFDAITLTFMADPQTLDQTLTGRQFVGTGPFIFEEWAQGDHLSVRRNAGYWQSSKPYVEGAELRVFRDRQQALIALETGSVDWVVGVAAHDARRLQSEPDYQVLENAKGSLFYYLGLDVATPALADKRVRQALGYALNRQRIVDTVLSGFARAASTAWPQQSPAYDANLDKTYAFDLNHARQLLNDAGWPAATAVPLFVSEAQPATIEMAEIVQADLATVDMSVTIQALSQADFVSRLTKSQFQGAWITGMAWMNFSPATFFNLAFPVRIPNSSNFVSPTYKRLIDQLSAATDDQQQRQSADDLTRIMLDEAFIQMICESSTQQSGAEVARSSVKNIVADGFRLINYQDLWLEDETLSGTLTPGRSAARMAGV
jgi:peptide/nickel transport system substrate-binding protein